LSRSCAKSNTIYFASSAWRPPAFGTRLGSLPPLVSLYARLNKPIFYESPLSPSINHLLIAQDAPVIHSGRVLLSFIQP
jgi:hypothetical protein